MEANKEVIDGEIEALQMTLHPEELVDLEQTESQTDLVLIICPTSLEDQPILISLNRNSEEPEHYVCKQLPCIKLKLTLNHETYPSSKAPQITIQSAFYNKFAWQIVSKLNERWEEDAPVLFDWFTYCQDEMIQEITSLFEEVKEIPQSIQSQLDSEQATLKELQFNTKQELVNFQEEQFWAVKFKLQFEESSCLICFESFVGSEKLHVFQRCLHMFCKECLRATCENYIKDGQLDKIQCPDASGCQTMITLKDLESLEISQEMITKVQEFSINKAIDSMEDFSWCPQKDCGAPAEVNQQTNLGICGTCDFQFCIQCKFKYHPHKRCQQAQVKREEANYEDSEATKRKLQELDNYALNQLYLQNCSKACPNCKAQIQKTDGCNKMTCHQCNKYFCWCCLEIIADYTHFHQNPRCWDTTNSESQLQEQLTEQQLEMFRDDDDDIKKKYKTDLLDQLAMCPKCITQNCKEEKINHMICEKCKAHYCFMCLKELGDELGAKQHFDESTCYYKDI